jgi:hypothetical protein
LHANISIRLTIKLSIPEAHALLELIIIRLSASLAFPISQILQTFFPDQLPLGFLSHHFALQFPFTS